MDPRINPYAPGAGTPPPELAGRDDLIEKASITLARLKNNLPARSFILYGLRGVGKTVLLNRLMLDAENEGFFCIKLEATEKRSLAGLLVPQLRSALIKISRFEKAKSYANRALCAIAGFVSKAKMKYDDIEFSIDIKPEHGLADSGDFETDLMDLFVSIGQVAREMQNCIVIFVDEIQYVSEAELSSLILAWHKVSQLQLPFTLVAAGLPQIVGQMGRARSYAERLFEFYHVDKLEKESARIALCKPAQKHGVNYTNDAISEILNQTKSYPYFLQEWGKHSWDYADTSPIELSDVKNAHQSVIASLDASFFKVRLERLTPMEKTYLYAMAELGEGPHRSGDIAERMQRDVKNVAPVRNSLIKKGMIFSPAHGDTAFTVPLFSAYLKRTLSRRR